MKQTIMEINSIFSNDLIDISNYNSTVKSNKRPLGLIGPPFNKTNH